MTVELRYGPLLVGKVSDVFEHQGAWFGNFHTALSSKAEPLAMRLHEYICFCDGWHRRIRTGMNPDASEFDTFSDLVTSGLWNIVSIDGTETRIEQAPVFDEGEVSWRYSS